MQSLCGLAHFDYNMPGAHGYESDYANEAGVSEDRLKYIASTHLTSI